MEKTHTEVTVPFRSVSLEEMAEFSSLTNPFAPSSGHSFIHLVTAIRQGMATVERRIPISKDRRTPPTIEPQYFK
jgi:hypothetical protein